MSERLAGRGSDVSDSSAPQQGRNGPARQGTVGEPGLDLRTFQPPEPSWELVGWLRKLTPPGAPVIPIGTSVPHGTRDYDIGAYYAHGVPCLRLAASPKISADRTTRLKQIRERMPAAYFRESGRQAPRKGVPLWKIEAAFYRDLAGLGTAEIADIMELRDDSTRGAENGSRSARRYVEGGRRQLVPLGAWPWTLQPQTNGKLPPAWYREERFLSALAGWHFHATTQTIQDCLRVAERAAGSERLGLSVTVYQEAAAAYLRVYDAQRRDAPNTSPEND